MPFKNCVLEVSWVDFGGSKPRFSSPQALRKNSFSESFCFQAKMPPTCNSPNLLVPSLQSASAGCAKRKQSARPPAPGGAKACRIMLKKPRGRVLSGVRVTLRGHPLHLCFSIIFFASIFSCYNPPQGHSMEPPRDAKITKIPTFC